MREFVLVQRATPEFFEHQCLKRLALKIGPVAPRRAVFDICRLCALWFQPSRRSAYRLMRTALRSFITLCSLLFLAGAIAAYYQWIEATTYIVVTGIVGSLASVIGLIALALKPISSKDFKDIDVDLMKDLSDRLRELQDYDKRVSEGKAVIDRLAQERAELEILVRQASLKAFLEEKVRMTAQELNNKIAGDTSMIRLLDDYRATKARAEEISATIERSERADMIESILLGIGDGTKKKHSIYISIGGIKLDIAPLFRMSKDLAEVYARALFLK